ncbi:MAG: hypothetical protein WC881_06365 [Elusimicrobiota bacterium]|jgi:hypothetical protein
MKMLKRIVSLVLSAALVALSPGFASYEAFGQAVMSRASVKTSGAPVTRLAPVRVSAQQNPLALPTGIKLSASLPSLQTPTVKTAIQIQVLSVSAPLSAQARTGESAAQQSPAPAQSALVSDKVAGLSEQIGSELKSAGDISRTGSENASTLGARLNDILTGAQNAPVSDAGLTPVVQNMGTLASQNLARPADAGMTPAAADQQAPPAQPPSHPLASKDRSPLLPRLLSSGLALLPAIFLGWPLVAGGTVIAGGAVIAASLLLAALPFMRSTTPKFIRSLPGVSLLGLSALALIAGSPALGVLVGLGGWGLMRYGRSQDIDKHYEDGLTLAAFFGGLAAITGVGLALLSPAGWLAVSLKVISYPATALLFVHLPSWLGHGIYAIFNGIYASIRGADRVESSLRNDTNSYERLQDFSKAQINQSVWNAIWLSAIWVPVWLSQLVQWALGIAGGVAAGTLQAPILFLWGAAYGMNPDSRSAKFFAAWAKYMFYNGPASKKTTFNRLASPLIPYANSRNKLVSLPALFGLRLLQWLWLGHAALGTPIAGIIGFFKALQAEPAASSNPGKLRPDYDDVPNTNQPTPEEPGNPGTPSQGNLFPRLLAGSLALAPAYFIGLPLLASAGPIWGGLYLAAAASLALLPFIPAKTPSLLRSIPGFLLTGLGLALLYTQPWTAGLALLKTQALWTALSAVLGGWGFSRYLGKTIAETKSYDVEDPEYIGAFFGAVAAIAGLGMVTIGLTGTLPLVVSVLAYLTSPLLLMHLPAWTFWGFWTPLAGLISNFYNLKKSVQVWKSKSSFYQNVGRFSRFWLNKSNWNGSWLMPLVWVPLLAMQAADLVVQLAVSLALSALRLPFDFLWGVIYKAFPESGLTRFFSGLMRSWNDNLIGRPAQESFLSHRYVAPLFKDADAAVGASHRPAFSAVMSIALLRVYQLVELIQILTAGLLTSFFIGIVDGFKNIRNAPSPNDDPSHYYLRK